MTVVGVVVLAAVVAGALIGYAVGWAATRYLDADARYRAARAAWATAWGKPRA